MKQEMFAVDLDKKKMIIHPFFPTKFCATCMDPGSLMNPLFLPLPVPLSLSYTDIEGPQRPRLPPFHGACWATRGPHMRTSSRTKLEIPRALWSHPVTGVPHSMFRSQQLVSTPGHVAWLTLFPQADSNGLPASSGWDIPGLPGSAQTRLLQKASLVLPCQCQH